MGICQWYSFSVLSGNSSHNAESFLYIGICRQVGNLRESMTIETGVNVLIKVLLGNLAINSVLWFSKWVFSVTKVTGGVIIGESDFRGLEDSSVNEVQLMVLMVIGIIFLVIAIVCAATIFITMVGRTIQLYMLAATGPLAVSCIPGDREYRMLQEHGLKHYSVNHFQ